MSNPNLFLSALLAPAEFFINQILELDGLIKKQLSSHAGTVLKVHCTSPELVVFLIVDNDGVRLSQDWNEQASATFKGSAFDLIGLLTSKEVNLHKSNVEVSGNMQKAQAIQQILSASNIDWEYHLSRVLGDIPTQAFSDIVKESVSTTSKNMESMKANIDEYIHEEARWLPGEDEINSYQERLSELQLRMDRLGARVNILSNK